MSKGADFQLSDNVNKNNVFLVLSSELNERFDAEYYQLPIKNYNTIRLSSIVNIKGGKRLPAGHSYISEMLGYKYFRVAETSSGCITIDNLKNISEDTYLALKNYELNNNDIIFSIAGTIGKIFVFEKTDSSKVILTENCAKLTLKNGLNYNPKFLAILLNLGFVDNQVRKSYVQTTIPKLGLDRLGKILIPNIVDINFQEKIIDFYNVGQDEVLKFNNESISLLNGINDYLLKELGISVPEVDNALANRIFYTKLSTLNQRLDPTYYFNNKTQVEGGIYENILLKNIVNFIKGSSITSGSIIEGDYPVIAGGQTSPYNHNTYNFSGETITISASGAYSGYVWYHDYPIFASDCTVLTIRNKKIALIQYIFEILKLKQQEIYKLQKGAGQPHVYASDLAKIQIPLPDLPKQQEIVNHISQLRAKAKELEQQAEEILHTTTQQIEKMILGEVE